MREFIKIKESGKGKNKTLSLEISQYLTIDDVAELKKNVLKRLKTSNAIAINIKMAENIDVSGLQMLFAIKQKANELGINYKCNIETSNELESLLFRAGFEKLLTEIQNNNQVN